MTVDVVRAAAQPMFDADDRIDTVVLACTHFPLVEDDLAKAFGPGVTFVHGAQGIARRVAHLCAGQPFARSGEDLALYSRQGDSPPTEDVAALAPVLARHGLGRIAAF